MPASDGFGRYRAFVAEHRPALSALESALSAATWLLPERFSASEVSLEAIAALVGLVGLVHDTMAEDEERENARALMETPAAPTPPVRRRLFTAWPFYVSAVRQVEYLVELVAEKRTSGDADNAVHAAMTTVEGVKALCRVLLLLQANGRLLVDGGAAFNERHGRAPYREDVAWEKRRGTAAVHAALQRFATREHAPALAPAAETAAEAAAAAAGAPAPCASEAKDRKALAAAPRKPAHVIKAQRLHVAAELVHVLRPVVYAALLRKWGRRAWTPWITSLGLDAASLALHRAADTAARGGGGASSEEGEGEDGGGSGAGTVVPAARRSLEEEEELARRRRALAFYLLRSPIFDAVVAGPLNRLKRGAEAVPVVGTLVARGLDIAESMQASYYYVNGT